MKTFIIGLIILLALTGLGIFVAGKYNSPTATTTPDNIKASLIRVASPLPGAIVSSPLIVTGEARGNWFFEATFPIRIEDENGIVLGNHYAEAQGDWMTTNFVPFVGFLTFSTSTTATGNLVLEKDNPSGLPENAAEVRVPVRFAVVGTSKTPIQDAVRAKLIELGLTKVTLIAASLNNGVLTLTFSDPQFQTSGGAARVTMFREAIEATAKKFEGVKEVRLKPDEVFQP
ncbi:MAG: hypothetical protein A2758_02260 [Candidatus Zambryskibacteria bacterium RIFCSPHIGHO2_01_FULL_49_18]|uniref:Bacterial spore germination immunoglobulin-like domain-containing protein n=2 Tax=Candidatus Zambryskiibacteriota TaxID=1817925 RepID=A0A1G2T1V8_9BACT|nr:MAG: hypothetical protein A2758_02260 [Candidatus Zambryskibacteria bacterium RIFCSPHIGHO2_01_FULL_49_18]OHB06147.1 MAG: hypothetical protein A3A26_01220 [Candidatus Zambryskibacteria bacterium RIFCSPLOWO2_01_FULL_47_14]